MLSLVITTAPGSFKESTAAEAAKDIVLDKCTTGNPIGGYDTEGNLIYGGDPAVLVDGDTVYMYQGHDASKSGTAYEIPEWQCYSTKDLVNWKYEGVIMKADKSLYHGLRMRYLHGQARLRSIMTKKLVKTGIISTIVHGMQRHQASSQ